MSDPTQPGLLALSGITKAFGGVTALGGVDFFLAAGEIHGLVGENGAGKSTLMKIIAGVHTDYQGEMRLDGRPVRLASPRDARTRGIGMVHQELSIVPDLSVAENVHLGVQPLQRLGLIDWRAMRRSAAAHLANLGIDVDLRARMGDLSLGLQQLVEVARVLFSGARIIILDEPTSALAPPEIERLFGLLRRLRESGKSLIFISHFLDDVLSVCDRLTVFRNGHAVATETCARIDKRWIIDRMIGTGHQELEESYLADIPLRSRPGAKDVLRVDNLSRTGAYRDVSMSVRAGEVLGIYGFLGSGQLELARTLFGVLRADRGSIALDGRVARLSSTSRARRAGIAFLPESRKMMLFGTEPVFKNVTIAILGRIGRLWLRPASERWIADGHVKHLHIRPPDVARLLGTLSGGNQQKVALAKWLTHLPRVLILSEPTRGMDVGAKDDVVRIVRNLRDQGIAILVVSTEPETVLSLADRILVMKKGRVVREFADEPVSKDRLLEAA
ncbi:sugar ABC transporter ATP-binding protein [Acidisphaera sp. S103]|uniref:sugar ABC transporter ATP-binding protein n=1 Tax=Acidisphaera sp. S103 TaxID=1747223 RepID=UPI00131C09E1|nr:sugar ABC transporter ATP-binding protein [Acidisphaera sp. S103]